MARETADYRDNLEDILAFTGGARMLSGLQVSKYLGLCFNTVKKRYPFKDGYISAMTLARCMSSMEAGYDRKF